MERQDLEHYLVTADTASLAAAANDVLLRTKGTLVHCRGLIEISNICKRNCAYCGLRIQNRNLSRYRLDEAEIMASAKKAHASGADTIVLQAGEGAVQAGWAADLVSGIKAELPVKVTLSFGECSWQDYKLWKDAGADRYLLKHETSSSALYKKLHPGYRLEDRLEALGMLKELGYETGSGFIVGLPGQTLESYIEDILLCKKLGAGMVGIGPFLPQNDTPLAGAKPGSLELTLRLVSMLRLFMPEINIPATTALASLDPVNGQIAALKAGANVLMPNFTPSAQALNYRIYDDKARITMRKAQETINAAGREHNIIFPELEEGNG